MGEETKSGASVDVMTLLTEEVERMVARAGKAAFDSGEAETQAFLQAYEQKAKQVILKVREEMRAEAEVLVSRFREALLQRVEQSSALALSETVAAVSTRTEEIVRRLQDAARRDARQVLANELAAGGETPPRPTQAKNDSAPVTRESQPAERAPEPVGPVGPAAPHNINSDFETWLSQ